MKVLRYTRKHSGLVTAEHNANIETIGDGRGRGGARDSLFGVCVFGQLCKGNADSLIVPVTIRQHAIASRTLA